METYTQSLSPILLQQQSFIRRVYNWMLVGLGLSAFISWFMLNNPELIRAYFQSPLRWVLPIGELVLIFWLFPRIQRMSTGQATFFFFLYAGMNGVTLTPLLIQYTHASIFSTLCVTGATFGVTSLYGYVTRKDLSSIIGFAVMGIIGLIIASLVNLFLQSAAIYWILTYAGVGLSIAVTAYYSQAIKRMGYALPGDDSIQQKGAIVGALMLYVAFVMMFVYLLQILGNRR